MKYTSSVLVALTESHDAPESVFVELSLVALMSLAWMAAEPKPDTAKMNKANRYGRDLICDNKFLILVFYHVNFAGLQYGNAWFLGTVLRWPVPPHT